MAQLRLPAPTFLYVDVIEDTEEVFCKVGLKGKTLAGNMGDLIMLAARRAQGRG